jgi:predicted phage tail protein
MKTLVLHGALAAEFGETFRMNVPGIAQAIRLMDCNTRGRFSKALYGKYYEFRWGDRVLKDESEVAYPTSADVLHIEPVVEGNIKGLFGLFAGLPVVGAAFAPLGIPLGGAFGGAAGAAGLGALGGFGAIFKGVLLLGVLYLISSALTPDAPEDKEADQRNSFLFDGAVNTTSQGGPVPLVYGLIRTGSVLIQGGIEIEDLSSS